MANWNDLAKRIPPRIRIGGRTYFEVCWVDDFADGQTLGETRFDPKQIVIKKNQSPKQTVLTYLHEVTHAASDHYGLGLTENQVLGIEASFMVLLLNGNLFILKKRKKR